MRNTLINNKCHYIYQFMHKVAPTVKCLHFKESDLANRRLWPKPGGSDKCRP